MKLEWVFCRHDRYVRTSQMSNWDLIPAGKDLNERVVGLRSYTKPMTYWAGEFDCDYPHELPADMTVDEAKVFLERQYLLMK